MRIHYRSTVSIYASIYISISKVMHKTAYDVTVITTSFKTSLQYITVCLATILFCYCVTTTTSPWVTSRQGPVTPTGAFLITCSGILTVRNRAWTRENGPMGSSEISRWLFLFISRFFFWTLLLFLLWSFCTSWDSGFCYH